MDTSVMAEDWQTLASFFPDNWRELARSTGAIRRLRQFQSVDQVMRVLLLHIAKGYSLRETAALAKAGGIAAVSDVALLKRLRSSEPWFQQLCVEMFRQRGQFQALQTKGHNMRLVDATVIKESGRTGSQWRVHYSLGLPSLACDEFRLRPCKGTGNGESFEQFAIQAGDCLLADRAYSTAAGISHVRAHQGDVIVRLNTGAVHMFATKKRSFDLQREVGKLRRSGQSRQWGVRLAGADGRSVAGRLCAIRKSQQAIELATRKIQQEAAKRQRLVKPQTLEYAKYVLVFTTLDAAQWSCEQVLQWYRCRWQIELMFKRLKTLVGLGQLPKHDEACVRAWLYGKLFVGLLSQKIIHHAETISPWGYQLECERASERLA